MTATRIRNRESTIKTWIVEIGLVIAGALLIALIGWLAWLTTSREIQEHIDQRKKRYTVYAASGRYQDLQRIITRANWAEYKKPTGQTIVFSGDFTEVEQ